MQNIRQTSNQRKPMPLMSRIRKLSAGDARSAATNTKVPNSPQITNAPFAATPPTTSNPFMPDFIGQSPIGRICVRRRRQFRNSVPSASSASRSAASGCLARLLKQPRSLLHCLLQNYCYCNN